MNVISCVKNICYIDEIDVSLAWVIVRFWSTVCLNCTFQELFLYVKCIHMKAMLVHSKIIIELYYFAFINLIIFIIKAYSMFWHYTLLVFVWTLNIVITHINIKMLKSELSWCCRNRILPVQHIWRAGSSVLSDPIES